MAWGIACPKDLPELERFLVGTEWKTVAFSSRVRNDQMLFEKQGYIILVNYRHRSIEEAVMFTPGGLVLPLLKYGTDITSSSNRRAMDMIIRFCPSIYSIMGVQRDVMEIENLLEIDCKKTVDYYLMVLHRKDWKSSHSPLPAGLHIRKASPRDLKQLFVLQEQYEIEEVCLNPGRFSRKGCLENLKKNMIQEIIFVAEMDGSLVAKAATNARGYNVDQIGGVYTIREKRSRGLGFAITDELLKYIFNTKQTVVLFVKTTNAAALKLYRNLGFREAEKYRITYLNV